MSSNTTPTRTGRGIPVPGTDTRGALEQSTQPLSFSGWPLTPPQPAHESRCPSLAFFALSNASHSGPWSISGYSQPATPVHSMSNCTEFSHQWTDGTEVQAMSTGLVDGCCKGHVYRPICGTAIPQPQMCGASGVEGMPIYSSAGHSNTMEAFGMRMNESPMRDAWTHPQQAPFGLNANPGLKTTSFQSTQGLGRESVPTASMYNNAASSMLTLEGSAFPNYDTSAPPVSASLYQPPQSVVPSQLSPHEDYSMEQSPGFDHDEVNDGFLHSFDSAATGYSGWEIVGQQSPHEAYFSQSEDEDYVMVKSEIPMMPSRESSLHRSRQYLPVGHSAQRARRNRSAKRTRKSQTEDKAWFQEEWQGLTIRCAGKRFMKVGDGQYITEESKDSKPHVCTFKDKDGEPCGRRFERSEHLKRHMGMHSTERLYPCPLYHCDKKIGRPDNAGDHFKTHLKPPGKGKRNKHCDWEELERAILDQYSEKMATKLIKNLRKWMVAKHEKLVPAAQLQYHN